MFEQQLRRRLQGRRALARLDMPEGDRYDVARLDLRPQPAVLRGHGRRAGRIEPITGARVLAMLGDSITTDHISPAGAIKKDSPAGRWLMEQGVEPRDFNSYGSRRGNHEVMMRGTFANVRLRNQLVDREGGFTRHLPDGEEMTIYEAAMDYAEDGVPLVVLAGKEYGSGSSRDWAAKGTAARRPRGDRRELRADPPLQPDRDGRAAAAVPRRRDGRVARARPARRRSTSATSRRRGEDGRGDGVPRRRRAASTSRPRSASTRPNEVRYFRNGGILQTVLRELRDRCEEATDEAGGDTDRMRRRPAGCWRLPAAPRRNPSALPSSFAPPPTAAASSSRPWSSWSPRTPTPTMTSTSASAAARR